MNSLQLIGYDPATKGGDCGCAVYGHKDKDGNVVITDIKYFNHEHH